MFTNLFSIQIVGLSVAVFHFQSDFWLEANFIKNMYPHLKALCVFVNIKGILLFYSIQILIFLLFHLASSPVPLCIVYL